MRNYQINNRENAFLAIKCFKSSVLCIKRVRALFSSSSFSSLMKEKCRNFVFKVYFLSRKIAGIDFFAYICNVILIEAMSK